MDCKKYANILKGISDERRLEILELLSHGEMCACKILENFEITQPTLSHHMKVLIQSGLIECNKRGLWCYYSLNRDKCKELQGFLTFLIEGKKK